jgi:prepilin-type processing-associated H-X9-DG protein
VIGHARRSARRTVCLSNLHQIGIAIQTYASETAGCIPYGPDAPPFNPFNFYPATGNCTSLISTMDGSPVALGLMLDRQLANTKKVLFCPDVDQGYYADLELSLYGVRQAQCDYYYRHASGNQIFSPADTNHLKLGNLGLNSQELPIRALAIDVNFLTLSGLSIYGIFTRTCHNRESVNVLFSDGHAAALDNRHDEFTVDATSNVQDGFTKILNVFEAADAK